MQAGAWVLRWFSTGPASAAATRTPSRNTNNLPLLLPFCRQGLGRYAGFELGQRVQLQELFDELGNPGAKRSAGELNKYKSNK
jgi:hypothetical protein